MLVLMTTAEQLHEIQIHTWPQTSKPLFIQNLFGLILANVDIYIYIVMFICLLLEKFDILIFI